MLDTSDNKLGLATSIINGTGAVTRAQFILYNKADIQTPIAIVNDFPQVIESVLSVFRRIEHGIYRI